LANAPEKPLPLAVRNRPKTGFSIPVYQWMAEITQQHRGTKPVAWAKFVAAKFP
jgi:hypothetical protein